MNEILDDIDVWTKEGEEIAVATVVRTIGSTPRPAGAAMAVTRSGRVTGSVSGGCLEGAIVAEAQAVLEAGHPVLLHFGITDDMAWDVGLSCGGEVDIFVEPLTW